MDANIVMYSPYLSSLVNIYGQIIVFLFRYCLHSSQFSYSHGVL